MEKLSRDYKSFTINKQTAKVFGPFKRCIYCPDGKPPFSREHVIPAGLGGGIILRDASCETCRKITQKIEEYCLRGPLLPHRLGLDLVQNTDDFKGSIPLKFIGKDGLEETKLIPIEEYPNYLALPIFNHVPVGSQQEPIGLPTCGIGIWGNKDKLQKLQEMGNIKLTDNFQLDIFMRFLAKVAHGLAVSYLGVDGFKPYLLDVIHDRTNGPPYRLIGKTGRSTPPSENPMMFHNIGLESIKIRDGKWLISAKIRLFPTHNNTPEYRAIAGEMLGPTNDLKERFNKTL